MPVSATEPTATTSTPSSVPSSSAASTGLVSATGLTASTAAGSISSTSSSTSSAVSVGSAASTAAPAATPSSAALARTPLTRTLQPGLAYWQWRLIQYQEHPDFDELCRKHSQFELAVGAWYRLDKEFEILIRFISHWDARYWHHGALHAWRKRLSHHGAVRFASLPQDYSRDLGNYLYAVALHVFAASCGPSDPLLVAITQQNDRTNGDCLEAVMGWYHILVNGAAEREMDEELYCIATSTLQRYVDTMELALKWCEHVVNVHSALGVWEENSAKCAALLV